MLEKVLAGGVALVCLALLLRMVLPPPQQARWDRWWRRRAEQARAVGQRLRQSGSGGVDRLRHGAQARREAERAIERARRPRPDVTREGNVIRPGRFDRDRGRGNGDGPDGRPPTVH